ncbi:MAG: Protein kinase domain protein [Myxococcaceae bacterium]|nr:Protein kinase domain protein [Myxococcaceae bacterium]
MKQIKLGIVISMVLGTALFGTTSSPAAPNANANMGDASNTLATVGAVGDLRASLGVKPTVSPTRGAQEIAANGSCPENMIEVDGDYCPTLEQKCLRWLDPETKMRCAEFAPTGECQGKTTHKRFCIDRFEYPNKPGEKPVIMKTWYEAKATCQSEGKRLCGESEWTVACEGQEHLPYPYGYARNAEACNIDKPHPDVNEAAIANPKTRDAEVARLWQGEPSGSREACVSPYGVHDMTGNVDEWVVNESGHPFKSGLKGGYWGPVRTRCRPMTTAHNEDFSFYQIGFRCCGDAAGAATPKSDAPGGVGSPQNPGPGASSSGTKAQILTGT